MDKKFFLHSIKVSLEAAGFSVDDLVQYCAKESPSLKEKSPSTGSSQDEKMLPFEVMYEGMVRSWFPLKGKKPLGVIFEKHLITLYHSSKRITWEEAMEYCSSTRIEGHDCDAGTIQFWKKLAKLSEREKQAFDGLMVQLGGKPIALSDKQLWVSNYTNSSDYDRHKFGKVVTPVDGKVGDILVGDYHYVHPVLALSASSSFVYFPFEVMYEGMIRSRKPLEGKKPLGVIFENHLIALYDSPALMIWKKAMEYCKKVKIEGHACDAGEIGFWRKLAKLSRSQKQAFDKLMVQLGGEPIALSNEWFWSSSCHYTCSDGDKYYWIVNPVSGSTGHPRYDNINYVRPVLDLSASSSWEEKSPSVVSSLEEKRFPFEVMYQGMIRSRKPLEGKKPLGVIFENHLVILHNSPEAMVWNEAMVYCSSTRIEGHACDAGEIGFWRKLLKLSVQQKQVFDELMVQLGGKPIALSKEWFWSSSVNPSYDEARYYWIVNPVSGSTGSNHYNNYSYYVRPVLALS